MKTRFSLRTLLWVIVFLCLLMAWIIDRNRLTAENEALNREATDWAELIYSQPSMLHGSDSSGGFSAQDFPFFDARDLSAVDLSAVDFSAPDFGTPDFGTPDFTTRSGREAYRQSLTKAYAGINGNPTMIAKGWDVGQVEAWIRQLGFEINEPLKNSSLGARKRWYGGYHFVTVTFENGLVSDVSEFCNDP